MKFLECFLEVVCSTMVLVKEEDNKLKGANNQMVNNVGNNKVNKMMYKLCFVNSSLLYS